MTSGLHPEVSGSPRGGGVDVPRDLQALPWEACAPFLGSEAAAGSFEESSAVVLPVPYEATTSWGRGTRLGPSRILEASRYVELYDREYDCEVAGRVGIHTLPALALTDEDPEVAIAELRSAYGQVAGACGDRFLVALGGEHTITAATVSVVADRVDARLSVLQLDAHADLRAEYQGTPYSHACAMARVLDRADVVAVGVRGVSQEEVEVSEGTSGSTLIWAHELRDGDEWMDRALDALMPKVYLTIDVDFFDPALVPSTGTPEPGGGDWYKTLRFLRRVFAEREVVAADVVELAPMPGAHAPDFLVAKLVYKLICYRFNERLR